MKQVISFVLAATMCLLLCACSKESTDMEAQHTQLQNAIVDSENKDTMNKGDSKYLAYTYDGEVNDLITVEEVVLMPQVFSDDYIMLRWKMKARNTSGEDILMKKASMRVWYRYLDANEDELWNSYLTGGYSSTIKDEQATWIEQQSIPSTWDKNDVMNVAFIEIYGYTNTLSGKPDYEFTDFITIDVREFFDWQDIL